MYGHGEPWPYTAAGVRWLRPRHALQLFCELRAAPRDP
jgi:hypothetical protein